MKSRKPLELYSFSIKRTGQDYQFVTRRWCKDPYRTREYLHLLDMMGSDEKLKLFEYLYQPPDSNHLKKPNYV